MKTKQWLHLVVILALAGFIAGCGKSNKTGTAVGTNYSALNSGNASAQDQQLYNSFLNQVNSGNFGSIMYQSGYGYYGEEYGYKNTAAGSSSSGSGSNNCELKWGFFWVCSYSSSSSYGTSADFKRSISGASVVHPGGGNTTAVHNHLISLANNASNIFQSGNVFYIQKSDGVYGFDFSQPMVANPVYFRASNGSGYYYLGRRGCTQLFCQ
jgi:hypothetical protein